MPHLGGGDPDDTSAASTDEPERIRDLVASALCAVSTSSRMSPPRKGGAEPAEHEIGVGNGRLSAAEPIADRTRQRAGAFRPDPQRIAGLETSDQPPPVPTSWMSIIGICIGRPVA